MILASVQENLRALQARDKAIARDKQQRVDDKVNAILSEGGNPEVELIHQRKLEEYEKEKEWVAFCALN